MRAWQGENSLLQRAMEETAQGREEEEEEDKMKKSQVQHWGTGGPHSQLGLRGEPVAPQVCPWASLTSLFPFCLQSSILELADIFGPAPAPASHTSADPWDMPGGDNSRAAKAWDSGRNLSLASVPPHFPGAQQ